MASNHSLTPVTERGWLNGFGNLFHKESHQWWGTWQWAIQILIWLAIVNGMLAMVVLAVPRIEEAQARQEISQQERNVANESLELTGLMVFFVFCGLAPAVGVVIIGQEAVVGERQSGTAAWVLSKPVSRVAFILSKLASDALGVLVTMVIAQGAVAYVIFWAGTGNALPVGGFLGALGMVYLLLMFYLSLTTMLGTLFQARGPIIGIAMIVVFGNNLSGLLPWLGKIMPWNLVMDLGAQQPALAVRLVQGLPLPTITPIIGTLAMTLAFAAAALWRFRQEEF
jgi:ABC-2 type transport system permease protein